MKRSGIMDGSETATTKYAIFCICRFYYTSAMCVCISCYVCLCVSVDCISLWWLLVHLFSTSHWSNCDGNSRKSGKKFRAKTTKHETMGKLLTIEWNANSWYFCCGAKKKDKKSEMRVNTCMHCTCYATTMITRWNQCEWCRCQYLFFVVFLSISRFSTFNFRVHRNAQNWKRLCVSRIDYILSMAALNGENWNNRDKGRSKHENEKIDLCWENGREWQWKSDEEKAQKINFINQMILFSALLFFFRWLFPVER